MKRLISAFLSIVMVASVFFCVDLSAYAAGDNDNYTMYQADYYSKNFSFDTPSFSQIYYDELSNDDLFITAVNAWETIHIATSPSYSLESGMITKKDYYKTVIFDLFAQSDSNDGLDNLLDIATNKQLSYAVNVSKAIMEAEDVTAETLNKVTPEKAINLIFGSKYCNIANGASVATKIAEWCQDAKEAVDTFSKYQAIYDLKNGTREFLNYIASDSSNPYELREAASECANYFENGYNEVLNQIIGGVQSIGDFTMKIITDTALDWAWTLIVSSIPGGKAVMIAAKGARALSNYLFSTDKEVEAYYKLEAQVAMENAIKSSVNQIKSSSNITSNLSDAAIYMNAVDGFRKAIILGFDYSIDLFEICANSKFNASTDGLFGSYTQCMNLVNQITNFKTEKENYFKIFENQCLNGYKNKYFPDYDSVLNGVEYQKIPVESISLSLIKDFSAGISGYINDYIKTEYSPSGYTEITMPNWESSNEGIIKFIPDYNGFCGGSFEAVSNGDCTITCSLSSGVSQSITVHVGEKQKEEEHDYYSDFEYRINSDGNTATITDYVGSSTNVLIPAVIDGYAITSIGDYAFQYCYSLIEITIPNSVTSIGYRAFSDCTSLTDVTIGNSVTSIGGWAFSDCTSLISIAIPNSVTDIGRSAFEGCTSLKSVTIPDSVTSIKDYTFGDCINLTDVKIGNSVTSIGECAFQNCQSLANVTIPNSVTSIGENAFRDCTSLEKISIPDNVTVIEPCVFYNCSNLKSVELSNNIASIGSAAFYNCISLTNILFSSSLSEIGAGAFLNCVSLKKIVIPESVKNIYDFAFGNCTSLNSVEILDNNEINIHAGAFFECSALEYLAMPCSAKLYYEYVGQTYYTYFESPSDGDVSSFSGLTSLKRVYLSKGTGKMYDYETQNYNGGLYNTYLNPWRGKNIEEIVIGDGIESIGMNAFYYCSAEKITIESKDLKTVGNQAFAFCSNINMIDLSSVITIGDSAFYKCSQLEKVKLGSLKYSENDAFRECRKLADVYFYGNIDDWCDIEFAEYSSNPLYLGSANLYINDTIVSSPTINKLNKYSFAGCNSLQEVFISENVDTIEEGAFDCCYNLSNVTISNGANKIDSDAFYACTSLTSVTIPDSVTSIGESAFYYCTSLTSVTIPDSVTSIGESAFYACTSLTDVTIGDSVTSIGGWAFSYCTSLTSIIIPDSVTSIGESAFYECTSLTDVTIGDSVTSIGECAFQNCQSLANVTIPNSVTSIGDSAFAGCDNIENVYYNGSATQWVNISFSDASSHPNSYADNFYITGSLELEEGLEEIPDCIFAHCKSLENITIPNSVTSIGSGAFYLCNNLKELTIPESVISIGTDAFLGCYNLENVYYNGSATQWINISFGNDVSHPNYYAYNFYITGSLELEEELEEIPDYTFKHCESLENVTIPNSVTSIGESAFYYCKSLTSVTIPDSVTSIGNNAFSGCTSLTSVTIPDSVTSMGNNAFSGCTSLTSITIPDSVTSIGESAFSGCTSLTSVTIPNSVTSIEDNAFDGCTSLTSITIPDSVTSIGNNAFSGCTSLTSVTIPDSVTSIGVEAFYKCTSLTDVTIGNGVTSIEYGTFSGCTSLTSIIIPDSVTSIDYYAFSDCTSLTDVTIGNGVTSIGYDAFSDCISLTEITIPNSVTSIDSCAFYHCRFLKELTIPESVTSIGTDAFLGCYSLENVYYPGSKKDWENISIGSGNSSLTNATIHFAKELSENIEDIETGIVVSENTGEALPENTELIVKEISPSGNGIKYDISLQKDGEEIQPNGNVTVKIPVPKNMDGFACKVYRQEADNTYTNMNATYQDGYMVFVTDHFSVYILTTGNPGVIAVVLGDVNGDYIVDAADAVMVQRYDAGLITLQDAQLIAADVTGDGTVDAADAVKIQRYDAGLISSV